MKLAQYWSLDVSERYEQIMKARGGGGSMTAEVMEELKRLAKDKPSEVQLLEECEVSLGELRKSIFWKKDHLGEILLVLGPKQFLVKMNKNLETAYEFRVYPNFSFDSPLGLPCGLL